MAGRFAEMMRIIREDEPLRPSTRLSSLGDAGTRTALQRRTELGKLSSSLRGELDWIVMKCLEKDRARRYETASGLASDVQRYLDDQPVMAGPPGASYRLKKFVKRNRAGVLAAALVAAALILGLGGTTYGLVVANAQRQLASARAGEADAARAETAKRAAELQQVADFQSEQLGAIVPELMGAHLRRAIIDAAPVETRADLQSTLGQINFTSIGLSSMQANVFDPALDTIEGQFADQPLVRAQLFQALAVTLNDLGLLDAALEPQEHALALRREVLGEDDPETLASLLTMGLLLQAQGKLDEAEQYHQEALRGRRRVLGGDHPDTLTSLDNIGLLLQAQGKLDEAEPYYREALDGRRRVLGDDHEDTLSSINNMGFLLKARGKLDEAEPYYRQAMEGFRRVLGDDHPSTLTSINNMGPLLQGQGELGEAEAYYREAMEGFRRVLGDDHPNTLIALNNMGFLLKGLGRLDEAEPYYRQGMEGFRRILGDGHPRTLTSIGNMASLLQAQGRLDEAEVYHREAMEGRRRVFGEDHGRTVISIINVADVLNALGRYAESETLARESIATGTRVLGENHWRVAEARSLLGAALCGLDRYAESEQLLLESYAALDESLPARLRERRLVPAAQRLVTLYEAWGEPEKAQRWRQHAGW